MNKLAKVIWNVINVIMNFIVFKMLHLKISEEKWNAVVQFVKFGLVGVSNTVISYVIYVVSLLLLQKNNIFPKSDYLLSQVIAFILSVLWSFYWNRKYVFDADNENVSWVHALIKTYISYAFTGLFLNTILSIFWVQVVDLSKMIVPIINLLVNVPLNFVMNKFWAFKKK